MVTHSEMLVYKGPSIYKQNNCLTDLTKWRHIKAKVQIFITSRNPNQGEASKCPSRIELEWTISLCFKILTLILILIKEGCRVSTRFISIQNLRVNLWNELPREIRTDLLNIRLWKPSKAPSQHHMNHLRHTVFSLLFSNKFQKSDQGLLLH